MSYDSSRLFDRARSALAVRPRTNLSALSRQLGVDRHTLEKAIRAERGISFRELQREIILSYILEALRSGSDVSPKEIASNLEYSSVQAFTRFVRKVSGETPAKLRRRAPEAREPKTARNDKEFATFGK